MKAKLNNKSKKGSCDERVNKSLNQAIRLLKKLKPTSFVDRLHVLIDILLSIDVSTENIIIPWLEKDFDSVYARKLYACSLSSVQSSLSFQISAKDGWALVCLDTNISSNNIITVPFSSLDQLYRGDVPASICAGDEIRLISQPKVWWIVQELRPQNNSLLLVSQEDIPRTSNFNRHIRSVPWYHEVNIYHIFGCMVRRLQILSKQDMLKFGLINSINNENLYEDCDEDKFTIEYFFEMPKIQISIAMNSLKELVVEEERKEMLEESVHTNAGPIKALQATAHVKIWQEKKHQVVEARQLLNQIDSKLIFDKDIWLAIGVALRSISRGSNLLLSDWIKWSTRGINEALESPEEYVGVNLQRVRTRVKSCMKAWVAQRPLTNCDHPVISRARVFLNTSFSKEVLKDGWVDRAGFVNPKLCFTPYAKEVLDAVVDIVKDQPLSFLAPPPPQSVMPRVTSSALGEMQDVQIDDIEGKAAIRVPSALHEYVTRDMNYMTALKAMPDSSHMVGMSDVEARIRVGDVIGVRETHSDGGDIFWHEVLYIDILLCRMKVRAVENPPSCWLEDYFHENYDDYVDNADIDDNGDGHSVLWLHVSEIWGLTVARIDNGTADHDPTITEQNKINYHVFKLKTRKLMEKMLRDNVIK